MMSQATGGIRQLLAVDADSIGMRCRFGYYDYIIVGSGIGGGVLAEQLVENNQRVLLIEKGGPVFSTHILNTPRPDYARGKDQSQEGNETIYAAIKQNIQTAEDSDPYIGGPVYCLGGRSNVWGLWTPKAPVETLQRYFPSEIYNYLTEKDDEGKDGYTRAFDLVTNNSQQKKIYPDGNIDASVLSNSISALTSVVQPILVEGSKVHIGPMATQFNSSAPYRFPQGAYSTTVSLMNRIFSRDKNMTVLMHHECLQFEPLGTGENEQVKSLTLRSVIDQKIHCIEVADKTKVILSAGTLCTPKIALNSGLQLRNELVGKGLIDHEFYALRIAKERIGESAPPLLLQCIIKSCGSTALLSVVINYNYMLASGGSGASAPIRQYIAIDGSLIGEREGLSRFRSPEQQLDTIQILFEYFAELDDQNEVLDIPAPEPVIRFSRRALHIDEASEQERQDLATGIRDSFRDITQTPSLPLLPDPPAPRPELLGFGVFAHEVGTMRMPSPSYSGSVVDKNLRVKGFTNLYVCDLSVFPVSPEANPTLTLTALSMRLAEHLSNVAR